MAILVVLTCELASGVVSLGLSYDAIDAKFEPPKTLLATFSSFDTISSSTDGEPDLVNRGSGEILSSASEDSWPSD